MDNDESDKMHIISYFLKEKQLLAKWVLNSIVQKLTSRFFTINIIEF